MDRRAHLAAILRNFAWSVLPITVPLLILGFSAVHVADSYMDKEIAELSVRQLDYLRDALELTLYELDALNLTLSSNKTVITSVDNLFGKERMDLGDIATARILSDSFNAQINARTYIDSVYFYLDKYPDRFLSTMDGIVQTTAFPDTDWIDTYKSIPADKTIYSEVRPSPKSAPGGDGLKILTLYRRIFPISGTHRTGVIVMNLHETFFDRLLGQAQLFPGQRVFLLDDAGHLIIGVGEYRESDVAGLEPNTGRLEPRGAQYAYSSLTDRYGWRIVALIPTASFNRMPGTIRNLIYAVLAGSLVFGAVFALVLARRRTRRLEAVVELFRKADSGEDLPEHPQEGHDEYDYLIQTLLRSFLRQRYATLQLSERKARAEVLELKALRAQLNPHFLFNTMDTLYWMVYGKDGPPSPAARAVEDLAALLRYSLERNDYVALEREIEATERYLSIHRLRRGDGLATRWKVDEAAAGCQVPKLILQPLVENCLQHAFRNAAAGRSIEVEARLAGDGRELRIAIRDDGIGMDAEQLERARAALVSGELPSDHIGLQNTNRRLKLLFGDSYGLELRSSDSGGTTVGILLPALRSGDGGSTSEKA